MGLQSVLVTDTNIWIDLENGDIIAEVFRLPCRFLIPDFAIPELIKPSWLKLSGLGLETRGLNKEQIAELTQLRKTFKRLSIVDLSAILLANMLNVPLLTGDRHVNLLAYDYGIEVHGLLWILDKMVDLHTLSPWQAAQSLNRMIDRGARLPVDECKDRLSNWS